MMLMLFLVGSQPLGSACFCNPKRKKPPGVTQTVEETLRNAAEAANITALYRSTSHFSSVKIQKFVSLASVVLGKVLDSRNYPQVCNNVKPANSLVLYRDDVVDVVQNARGL